MIQNTVQVQEVDLLWEAMGILGAQNEQILTKKGWKHLGFLKGDPVDKEIQTHSDPNFGGGYD